MVIKGQYFNGHVASQDLILWNYVPLIVGGEETNIISYTIKVTILDQSPSEGQWLVTRNGVHAFVCSLFCDHRSWNERKPTQSNKLVTWAWNYNLVWNYSYNKSVRIRLYKV